MVLAAAAIALSAQAQNSMTNYTLAPSSGEVEQIESIRITFPDTGIKGIDYAVSKSDCEVSLKNEDSGKVSELAKLEPLDDYAILTFALPGTT